MSISSGVTNDPTLKGKLFDLLVLKERAKELAFEGDRFYDLIRVSERHGKFGYHRYMQIPGVQYSRYKTPAQAVLESVNDADVYAKEGRYYYIAFKVSQKFKGAERERVFRYLNDPANWYITTEWEFVNN